MKRRRVYTSWQYAFANVFYIIFFLIGVGAILAALFYTFTVLQPRLWGVQTRAQVTKYYAFKDNPSNGKWVDYTFTSNDKLYKGTQEISETAYKRRLGSFTVWYMPHNPNSKRYVAIRDYGDIVVAGLGLLIGILFLYLPKLGRSIDARIEAGESVTTVRGCICGVQPRLMLTIEYQARKYGAMVGVIMSILIPVMFWGLLSSGGSLLDLWWFGAVLVAAYGGPFAITFWRWRKRGHSFRCATRRAGFQAFFWSPGSGPIQETMRKA